MFERAAFIRDVQALDVVPTELTAGGEEYVLEAGHALATYDQRTGARQVLSAIVRAGDTLAGLVYTPGTGPNREDQFFATRVCHPGGGRALFMGALVPECFEKITLGGVSEAMQAQSAKELKQREIEIRVIGPGIVAIRSVSDLVTPNLVITPNGRTLPPDERDPLHEAYLWCAEPRDLPRVGSIAVSSASKARRAGAGGVSTKDRKQRPNRSPQRIPKH